MLQHGISNSKLETLPPRPPTPPHHSHTTNTGNTTLLSRILSNTDGIHTPTEVSPTSSAAAAATPTDRSSRRVAWSTSTDYRYPPKLTLHSNIPSSSLLQIPSSADRQQPRKSILKRTTSLKGISRELDFGFQVHGHTPESFALMLESITTQLAGDDRLQRIDAHASLSSCLKATEHIPDPRALREKIGLLCQFIQRDILAQTSEGATDNVLVNHALSLLASLIWKESLPHDFCVFILEHTIMTLQNPGLSKDVAKHLMFIVGQQNFGPKIMTEERAGRMLLAAYQVVNHVKGKGIILGRLSVYRALLRQAKSVMMRNIVWLKDIFEGMLITIEGVRASIIAFGLEAATALGTESKVSRAFTEFFESPHEKGKYANYYGEMLGRMITSRSQIASVPRIWSVIILLLRSKPKQLESWEFWPAYLMLMQKCFNSSDLEVKAQANLAWNKLVFAIQPDEKTHPAIMKMLLQPFLGQLRRRTTGKQSKEAFQATISSVCNLLYYALRPTATHAQLDLFWDNYVVPLAEKLFVIDGNSQELQTGTAENGGSNQAIAILQALLDPAKKVPRPWTADRALVEERMRFDEFPLLDCKWVRKNSDKVLNVLQPLLHHRFVELGTEKSRIKDLWKGFLLSVAVAGAKEIKVSHEIMTCIARIYTMAHRFWQECPSNDVSTKEGKSTAFLDGFVFLLTETIDTFGKLPFTEQRLSIQNQNEFAVVATPSTTSNRTPKTVKSPVQCLVVLFQQNAGIGCELNKSALKVALGELLRPFYNFKTGTAAQVTFCQELLHDLSIPEAGERSTPGAIWCAFAKLVTESLDRETEAGTFGSSENSGGQLLGVSVRDKVRILEHGLTVFTSDTIPEWNALFKALCRWVRPQAGDGGLAIEVIDPLARCLAEHYAATELQSFVQLCAAIIKDARYPANEHSLDAARRKLWGATSTGRSLSIDPYKHLYPTINYFLGKAYEDLAGRTFEAAFLVERTTSFIKVAPEAVIATMLEQLGEALALWIQDKQDIMHSADSHPNMKVKCNSCPSSDQANHSQAAMYRLLEMVFARIVALRPSNDNLIKYKVAFAAALSSKHKSVASSAVELWNKIYGQESQDLTITYPEEMEKALRRLRPVADLKLPGFPGSAEENVSTAGFLYTPKMLTSQVVQSSVNFLESDEDSYPFESKSPMLPRRRSVTPFVAFSPSPSPLSKRSPAMNLDVGRSTLIHRMLSSKSPRRRKDKTNMDTTPRLRHDNSLIQFAVIESSPAPEGRETQNFTEHQKEIKERQQEENAAMFADLRSSPRPKPKSATKKLSLNSDLTVSNAADQEQPGTPKITKEAAEDNFIASSPTPHREQKKDVPDVDLPDSDDVMVDVPSSPPTAPERGPSPPPVLVPVSENVVSEKQPHREQRKDVPDVHLPHSDEVMADLPSSPPRAPERSPSPPVAALVLEIVVPKTQPIMPAVVTNNVEPVRPKYAPILPPSRTPSPSKQHVELRQTPQAAAHVAEPATALLRETQIPIVVSEPTKVASHGPPAESVRQPSEESKEAEVKAEVQVVVETPSSQPHPEPEQAAQPATEKRGRPSKVQRLLKPGELVPTLKRHSEVNLPTAQSRGTTPMRTRKHSRAISEEISLTALNTASSQNPAKRGKGRPRKDGHPVTSQETRKPGEPILPPPRNTKDSSKEPIDLSGDDSADEDFRPGGRRSHSRLSEEKRTRSSSRAEFNEGMVHISSSILANEETLAERRADAEKLKAEGEKVPYIALRSDENFHPEDYQVVPGSSPARGPEQSESPEEMRTPISVDKTGRKETRIVPPVSPFARKPSLNLRNSGRKSNLSAVASVASEQSPPTNSRMAKEITDRQLGGKYTPRVDRQATPKLHARNRSMLDCIIKSSPPVAKGKQPVEARYVIDETLAAGHDSSDDEISADLPSSPEKKEAPSLSLSAESRASAKPSTRYKKRTILVPEIPNPQPSQEAQESTPSTPPQGRKRKSVGDSPLVESSPIPEWPAEAQKQSRKKRRMNKLKSKLPEVVEDSQQDIVPQDDEEMRSEGITVPALTQTSPNVSGGASASTSASAKIVEDTTTKKSKKRRRGKKGGSNPIADVTHVDDSQPQVPVNQGKESMEQIASKVADEGAKQQTPTPAESSFIQPLSESGEIIHLLSDDSGDENLGHLGAGECGRLVKISVPAVTGNAGDKEVLKPAPMRESEDTDMIEASLQAQIHAQASTSSFSQPAPLTTLAQVPTPDSSAPQSSHQAAAVAKVEGVIEDLSIFEDADAEAEAAASPPPVPVVSAGEKVIKMLRQVLTTIGEVTITPEEAECIENLCWDTRREALQAEYRGRTKDAGMGKMAGRGDVLPRREGVVVMVDDRCEYKH